jgi:hypothetical protein
MATTPTNAPVVPRTQIDGSCQDALSSVVRPFEPILRAQFLGERFVDGCFEVVLNYYRWHVRIRSHSEPLADSPGYCAILETAYRDATGSTNIAARLVHPWRDLERLSIGNRLVVPDDIRLVLRNTRQKLESRRDVVAWVMQRRPY